MVISSKTEEQSLPPITPAAAGGGGAHRGPVHRTSPEKFPPPPALQLLPTHPPPTITPPSPDSLPHPASPRTPSPGTHWVRARDAAETRLGGGGEWWSWWCVWGGSQPPFSTPQRPPPELPGQRWYPASPPCTRSILPPRHAFFGGLGADPNKVGGEVSFSSGLPPHTPPLYTHTYAW